MDANSISTNIFQITVAEAYASELMPTENVSLESQQFPLLSSPSLRTLARPGMKVVISFTDATRPSPDRLLVAALRDLLDEAGVAPSDITLICATGLHRPMTEKEFTTKLGAENMEGVRCVNHSATDRDGVVELGEIDGIPVTVNRLCAEADLLIAVGIVEPHQYAGFSGGAKTLVIGCGGEATIAGTHGVRMLDKPGTRLGKIEGNPFQQFVRKAGERIGLRYVVNVLLGRDGAIIAGACGEPSAVHDALAEHARRSSIVTVDQPAQIAIAGVPTAKGVNLYQASRGATYIPFTDRTPLLPGGPIILPASIPEGAGEGRGEERFFRVLSEAASPAELVERLRREGFPPGAQRAYILARVLMEHPVIVAGAEHPEVVRACHMESAPDLQTALIRAEEIARRQFGIPSPTKLNLLVVPNALTTLVSLR